MPTFVALLRGVNVGTAKRVPMAELRTLLGSLGYTTVQTLLNSGNAVFEANGRDPAKHALDIASAMATHFGFEVPVIVLSATKVSAVITENPIAADAPAHSRFLVALVQDTQALTGLAELEALVVPPEQFALGLHAAYLLCANGILDSKAGKALLGKVGRMCTTRNWATVLKLAALCNEGGASTRKQPAPQTSTAAAR